MKKTGLALFVLVFLISSCKRDEGVSQINTFRGAVWERFDFLHFQLPVEDVSDLYDISAIMRYTKDFPGDYLHVNLVMTGPSGEERIRDYKLYVRDTDGQMLGEEKDGVYERVITIREDMRFGQTGKVAFEIENLMTKVFTPGIVEFGMMIKPAED